jgi:hypothetical protein
MMSETTEHTSLEVLLSDSVMDQFNWAFVEKCHAELAQLYATNSARVQDIESLRETVATARELYAEDQKRIAALEQAVNEARGYFEDIVRDSREPDEGDCKYCNCEQGGGNDFDCYYDCPMNAIRAWLAAHPAPDADKGHQA